MKKLKMKARAGVTLVELLVVILIVTILSVAMLPLLTPFVTEAQYAAEAIPVIGNLRTKIGVYEYDKGRIPSCEGFGGDDEGGVALTWIAKEDDSEMFLPAYINNGSDQNVEKIEEDEKKAVHIQRLLDVDYADLKGKRSKPTQYRYYAISHVTNIAYVVACFGEGEGLKAGTGYAVCELNYPKLKKKFVGTWKCYKPVDESNGQIRFVTNYKDAMDEDSGRPKACYVPTKSNYMSDLDTGDENKSDEFPSQVILMSKAGWDFGIPEEKLASSGNEG